MSIDWKEFSKEKPNEHEDVLVYYLESKEVDLLCYSSNPITGYWSCEADGECFWPDMWARINKPVVNDIVT